FLPAPEARRIFLAVSLAVSVDHRGGPVDEIAEKHSLIGSAYCSGPSASDMPQRVTMSRASWVAYWMSEEAPEETLSWPKITSSATRPPIETARFAYILSR